MIAEATIPNSAFKGLYLLNELEAATAESTTTVTRTFYQDYLAWQSGDESAFSDLSLPLQRLPGAALKQAVRRAFRTNFCSK
jgi:hypothetical protein